MGLLKYAHVQDTNSVPNQFQVIFFQVEINDKWGQFFTIHPNHVISYTRKIIYSAYGRFSETLIIYLFYIRLQKTSRVHEIFFLNERHLVGNGSVSKTYGSGGVDSKADNDLRNVFSYF